VVNNANNDSWNSGEFNYVLSSCSNSLGLSEGIESIDFVLGVVLDIFKISWDFLDSLYDVHDSLPSDNLEQGLGVIDVGIEDFINLGVSALELALNEWSIWYDLKLDFGFLTLLVVTH